MIRKIIFLRGVGVRGVGVSGRVGQFKGGFD